LNFSGSTSLYVSVESLKLISDSMASTKPAAEKDDEEEDDEEEDGENEVDCNRNNCSFITVWSCAMVFTMLSIVVIVREVPVDKEEEEP
jgi:hypothetical protein